MILPTQTDLAWAAGFFDGEGSVFVVRNKQHKGGTTGRMYTCTSVSLSISQVDRRPLDRWANIVGGRKPSGPYTPRNVKARPYYRWDASGRPSVHKVLCLIWPFLGAPKREQAANVWEQLRLARTSKSPQLPLLPETIGVTS